jgi:hypothetical protein
MTNYVDLVVDRSGSMDKLFWATVKGLQEFVNHQKLLPTASDTSISLTTFDDVVEIPAKNVPLLEYNFDQTHVHPRGTTALYDAVGALLASVPFDTPRTVVIVTDGEDNASKIHTATTISDQISERRKFGWTFIFLAANQDAIASGKKMSIPEETSCTFNCNQEGAVMGAMRAASDAIARGQTGVPVAFTSLERITSEGTQTDAPSPPTLFRASSIPQRSCTGFVCDIK